MTKFIKCTKCWREYFWYRCPNWCSDEKSKDVVSKKIEQPFVIENKKVELKHTTIKKETKPKTPKVVKPKENVSTETFKWLPLYTSSYMNNKLKINLNSIKNETCCVKVWDLYILHTDIINQFKNSL